MLVLEYHHLFVFQKALNITDHATEQFCEQSFITAASTCFQYLRRGLQTKIKTFRNWTRAVETPRPWSQDHKTGAVVVALDVFANVVSGWHNSYGCFVTFQHCLICCHLLTASNVISHYSFVSLSVFCVSDDIMRNTKHE